MTITWDIFIWCMFPIKIHVQMIPCHVSSLACHALVDTVILVMSIGWCKTSITIISRIHLGGVCGTIEEKGKILTQTCCNVESKS